jgi:arylsulfatase A-like enzyme
VEDNTLVVMSSDNGPWAVYGNHAGKTPFRESKMTGFDGGIRSACIMRYPGQIRRGEVSKRTFCSIDLMPTIAKLAGAPLPANEIDGKDVWDLITEKPGATNPHPYYAFSTARVFEGVISGDGRWKLHVPHEYSKLIEPGRDGKPGKTSREKIDWSLFDMEGDPNETTNVIDKFPEVTERMKGFAEEHRKAFYS